MLIAGKSVSSCGAFVAAAAIHYQNFQPVAIAGKFQSLYRPSQSRGLVVSDQNGRYAGSLRLLLDALGLLGGLDAFAGGIDASDSLDVKRARLNFTAGYNIVHAVDRIS